MKKFNIFLLVSSLLLAYSTPIASAETNDISTIETQSVTDTEVDVALYELANLSIDDLIDALKVNGVDPLTVFSEQDIQQARRSEMMRKGKNMVFTVNSFTKDIYINSYISVTLKTVGLAGIMYLIPGWSGKIVGAIAGNFSTTNGVIVRVQRKSGADWGVNGDVWAITGLRSQ